MRRVGAEADGRQCRSTSTSRPTPRRSSCCRRWRGVRQADRRFRHVEDALGRHQPLPAHQRRHRAAVRRRGAEHSRGVHSARWGSLASFGARAYPGTKKMVRHQRQQLRRRRRVRRQRARAGGDRRRRERRSRRRRTSTMRPRGTRPAICERSIFTRTSSRGTSSGPTILESNSSVIGFNSEACDTTASFPNSPL